MIRKTNFSTTIRVNVIARQISTVLLEQRSARVIVSVFRTTRCLHKIVYERIFLIFSVIWINSSHYVLDVKIRFWKIVLYFFKKESRITNILFRIFAILSVASMRHFSIRVGVTGVFFNIGIRAEFFSHAEH